MSGKTSKHWVHKQITAELQAVADPARAAKTQQYFKTGPGEYGEGDVFIGLTMPQVRKFARQYRELSRSTILALLHSMYHEERMLALLILVEQFKRGSETDRQEIYELYLQNTERVNNWDLVDSSAHLIVGPWLQDRDRSVLTQLAGSDLLWERRISIIATAAYIRQDDFDTTLVLSEVLLHDKEDLMHKAVGWMLREVGNRDRAVEEAFLRKHYRSMPRTMLRYAIEKYPEDLRQCYLKGEI